MCHVTVDLDECVGTSVSVEGMGNSVCGEGTE